MSNHTFNQQLQVNISHPEEMRVSRLHGTIKYDKEKGWLYTSLGKYVFVVVVVEVVGCFVDC